jgi:hypothetical protein
MNRDCIELVAKRDDVRFLPIAGLSLQVRPDFLVDERDRLFFCHSLSLRSRTDSSWRRMTVCRRGLCSKPILPGSEGRVSTGLEEPSRLPADGLNSGMARKPVAFVLVALGQPDRIVCHERAYAYGLNALHNILPSMRID